MRGAAQLQLRPAAEGRADLLATVSMPRPDRSFGRAAGLAKELGVQVEAAGIRPALASILRLPAGALAALRTDARISAAVVQTDPAPHRPTAVIAAALDLSQSPAQLQASGTALAQALGAVKRQELDAWEIELSGGGAHERIWLLVRQGIALVAETEAALVAGGALALEARAAETGASAEVDLTGEVYPEAIARAQGVELPMLVYRMKENAKVAWRRAGSGRGRGGDAHFTRPGFPDAVLDVLAGRAVDVAGVSFEVVADPKVGLALRGHLRPKPESGLARSAAVRSPLVFDGLACGPSPRQTGEPARSPGPTATSGPPAAPPRTVAAAGALPIAADLHEAIAAVAAAQPNGPAWVTLFDQLAGALTGTWSSCAEVAPAGSGYQFVSRLAEGVEPTAVLDLITRLGQNETTREVVGAMLGGGGEARPLKVTRARGRVRIESLPPKLTGQAVDREAAGSVAGDERIEIALAAIPGRLFGAVGPGAPARLDRLLAAAKEASPAGKERDDASARSLGLIGAALAASQGPDLFAAVDLGPRLRATFAAAPRPKPPSSAASPTTLETVESIEPAPLWFALRGGTSIDVDLKVPLVTIAGVARLAGAMAAFAGRPPP